MRRCDSCNALLPAGLGHTRPNGDYVCCEYCVSNPAGCRCALGEYGVPESLSVCDEEDGDLLDGDGDEAVEATETILCEHAGCADDAMPCYLSEDLLQDPPVVTEWFCPIHAFEAGYCMGCGQFWSGIESFDFGNGFCEHCASAMDDEDDDDYLDDYESDEEEHYP